jgi:site-specific recombinase XerC
MDINIFKTQEAISTFDGAIVAWAMQQQIQPATGEKTYSVKRSGPARHTYARIVAEESGSLKETQEVLGHRNEVTTRVYVQRIGVRRDRFSSRVANRLEL